MPVRPMAIAALGLVALLAGGDARAQTAVDVELVLAVDMSQSMDPGEHELQRSGYLSALLHPDVLEAIRTASTAGSRSPTSSGAVRGRRR